MDTSACLAARNRGAVWCHTTEPRRWGPGQGHVHQEEGCSFLILMTSLDELGWSCQLSVPSSLPTSCPWSPSSISNAIRLTLSFLPCPQPPLHPNLSPPLSDNGATILLLKKGSISLILFSYTCFSYPGLEHQHKSPGCPRALSQVLCL